MAAWYDEAWDYLRHNIWVLIASCVGFVLIVAVVSWLLCCRRRRKNGYATLEGVNPQLNVKPSGYGTQQPNSYNADLEKGRRGPENPETQAAAMRCQYFLRANQQYRLLKHLENIGTSKVKAHFVVKPLKDVDQLMTMLEPSRTSLLPLTNDIKTGWRSLLVLVQHPYIMPTHTFDMLPEQKQVVTMQPLAVKGSVRDAIHSVNPIAPASKKYKQRGNPLPLKTIGVIGSHVLQGLMFLKKRKIAYRSLHCGSVLQHSGAFRLTGLENTFFGHTLSQDTLVCKGTEKCKGDPTGWDYDVVCFGRMLFEMALGYELRSSLPDVEQLVGKCEYQIIEILIVIFYHPDKRVPSLEEVYEQPLFARVPCPELDKFLAVPMINTEDVKKIIKAGKKLKPIGQKKKTRTSQSNISTNLSTMSSPPASRASTPPPPPPPATQVQSQQPPPPPPSAASPAPSAPSTTAAAPPAPAPASEPSTPKTTPDSARGNLLASIAQGKTLKKTVTVDKSGPLL